jgi:hypothetical protein
MQRAGKISLFHKEHIAARTGNIAFCTGGVLF